MRVMHEPIENRIAKRGVADQIVPVIDGNLTGDQRGASVGSIFDDFQHVAAFAMPRAESPPSSNYVEFHIIG